jgi:hypothetical protein
MKTLDHRTAERLRELAALDYNYDAKVFEASQDRLGWKIDSYHEVVGQEESGPPVQDGAYQRLKNAIQVYQFPNPHLIHAVFDPDSKLEGRNMLLIAHFMGFTFQFGVRVVRVYDEIYTNAKGHQEQVWGYAYRTLKGHFEVGEISFRLSKDFETGEIFFSINAYSKPDRIPQFYFRWGFKIFGRPLQRYFALNSMSRLRDIASFGGALALPGAPEIAPKTTGLT